MLIFSRPKRCQVQSGSSIRWLSTTWWAFPRKCGPPWTSFLSTKSRKACFVIYVMVITSKWWSNQCPSYVTTSKRHHLWWTNQTMSHLKTTWSAFCFTSSASCTKKDPVSILESSTSLVVLPWWSTCLRISSAVFLRSSTTICGSFPRSTSSSSTLVCWKSSTLNCLQCCSG